MKMKGKGAHYIFIFFVSAAVWLFMPEAARAVDRFSLSEAEWRTGSITQGRIAAKRVTIVNRGDGELALDLLSDAQRLSAEPPTLTLSPGGTAPVDIFFDSNGKSGDFSHHLIFREKGTGMTEVVFPVEGKVDSSAAPTALEFYYFYGSDCHLCQEFINITVPGLERKVGLRLSVLKRDVTIPAYLTVFMRKMKLLRVNATDLPAVIIGDTVLQGKKEIDEKLEGVLEGYAEGRTPYAAAGQADTTASPPASGPDDVLAVIPVLLAGLLDGINPCVFSTLIFLLAYLGYVGRTKRQILLIGIIYSCTVFVTYYLIGLGFFRVIQAASAFPVISLVIQVVLWIVLMLFGALSVYDFIKIRQNKIKEVKLQLPDRFKERIRKTIRTQAASLTIVASSIVVAFLVTLFELACTGQIYLPTITSLVQTRRSISDFIYLAVYNLAFVAPLVIVFFLAYRGLTSQKLTAVFQKHLALVKMLTALLFFGLAVLVAWLNIPLLMSYLGKLFPPS